MTRTLTELRGMPVWAIDGRVGLLADVHFHDTLWLVRSLVVEQHTLVPVSSVQRCRFDAGGIRLPFAMADIAGSGRAGDLCARSARSLVGYRVETPHGTAGRIGDVIVDDAGWWIPELIIDTRNLFPGRRRIVRSSTVRAIDSIHRTVRLSPATLREALSAA